MRTFQLALVLVAACGDSNHATPDAPPQPPPPDAPPMMTDPCNGMTPSTLDPTGWYGNNAATLTQWLDSVGCKSPGYDPAHKPIALWDWDNTISKNDFGDAITYYMVANGLVLQPPNQDWQQTSPFLTTAAVSALSAACGTTVAAGQPLPTNTSAYANCADEILWIYDNAETRAHAPAFLPGNARRNVPDFAWTPQLMAGYTHAQLQQFTTNAITPMLAAPIGTTQTIGTTVENGWLRIYDQQKDLIHAAQTRGIDTWIITASPQDTIGVAAQMVNIQPDHVVGIRSMTDANGKTLYNFEGCGPYPDGQTDVIPHIQGKRCFINRFVFGDTTAEAIERRLDGQRQVFASADTDADVEFLRDAKYKLTINRNKADMMCHAYYNEHGTWLVQPMFINPKPAVTTPYPCSTSAFTNEGGGSEPTRDEGGNIIPDQTDTVHVP